MAEHIIDKFEYGGETYLLNTSPILTKTYTGVIASANDQNNGALYCIKILPDDYYGMWSIRYKVTATIAGISAANGYGKETSEVFLTGIRDTYSAYRAWNDISSTSYRPYYYHCFYRAKAAGITGGYGHAMGIHLRYSYNPATTANARTVTFKILEAEGCTVSFFDSPLTYAHLPGTGTTNYNTYTNFDATTYGWTFTGDRNDVNYYNKQYYGIRTAKAAIYRYQFCLTTQYQEWLPINSVNNSITTNKTLTTEEFDPFGDIVYWASTSTYAAGANVGDGSWFTQYLCDLRYSFNCGGYDTTATLVGRKPLYLVAQLQTNGMAKLHSQPLSQALPTVEDNLIYIYLGQVYPDTKPYRVQLVFNHPVYAYKNGGARTVSGYAVTSEGIAYPTFTTEVDGLVPGPDSTTVTPSARYTDDYNTSKYWLNAMGNWQVIPSATFNQQGLMSAWQYLSVFVWGKRGFWRLSDTVTIPAGYSWVDILTGTIPANDSGKTILYRCTATVLWSANTDTSTYQILGMWHTNEDGTGGSLHDRTAFKVDYDNMDYHREYTYYVTHAPGSPAWQMHLMAQSNRAGSITYRTMAIEGVSWTG